MVPVIRWRSRRTAATPAVAPLYTSALASMLRAAQARFHIIRAPNFEKGVTNKRSETGHMATAWRRRKKRKKLNLQ